MQLVVEGRVDGDQAIVERVPGFRRRAKLVRRMPWASNPHCHRPKDRRPKLFRVA